MEILNQLDKFITQFSKKSDEQNVETTDDITSIEKEFMETLANAISERYNDDFYFTIIKPVIKQLITFRDDTAKGLGYLKQMLEEQDKKQEKQEKEENKKNENTNAATDYSVQILGDVISGIDDMLLSYDVFPYRCEGTTFDPKRQRVVKTIPTTTPEQIKTVAESRSEGYERRGVIISKELVYAYVKQTEQRSDN